MTCLALTTYYRIIPYYRILSLQVINDHKLQRIPTMLAMHAIISHTSSDYYFSGL